MIAITKTMTYGKRFLIVLFTDVSKAKEGLHTWYNLNKYLFRKGCSKQKLKKKKECRIFSNINMK